MKETDTVLKNIKNTLEGIDDLNDRALFLVQLLEEVHSLRDKEICKQYFSNEKGPNIGKRFSLTAARVSQIVRTRDA